MEHGDSIITTNQSLSEINNDTLATSLSFAASLESMETVLGVEPDGYFPTLFNEWLKRIGRIPYSRNLNYFVYERLPEFDLNALVEIIGEEALEKVFKLPFLEEENDVKILLEKLREFVSKLRGGLEEELFKIINELESKSKSKVKAIVAVYAHLINKSINNAFVASS